MCANRSFGRKLGLILALSFLLGRSTLFAGEDLLKERGEPSCSSLIHDETESSMGTIFTRTALPCDPNPLTAELREARAAGDSERTGLIEAALRIQSPAGESAGSTVRRASDTCFQQGEAAHPAPGFQKVPLGGAPQKLATDFGTDRHVRDYNLDGKELYPTAATTTGGVDYVAWQDDALAHDSIQIYSSIDGGETWTPFGFLFSPTADLKQPCLTVGEGNENCLLVAYIVDNGIDPAVPEVAVAPLGELGFFFYSIPVWTAWEGYAKPVIWTDSADFSVWYVYLTCEGIFNASEENINICAWKATNFGAAWGYENVVYGNSDTYAWRDPDGTYGTMGRDVFLIGYNDDLQQLCTSKSTDYGVNYSTPQMIVELTTEPDKPVDPEIEAAALFDNIMVCCTKFSVSSDCIGQMYSQ
ncbi:MAG: hypothetical protein ABIK28_03685, partial [Planctomycetota bacterium]